MRIIHIHTDKKFIADSLNFANATFDNLNIIIQKNGVETTEENKSNLIYFNINEFEKIVDFCSAADLVVLYSLDIIKSQIALRIPNSVKVGWRFFGVELYGKKHMEFVSYLTFKYGYDLKDKIRFKLRKYSFFRTADRLLRSKIDKDSLFSNAVKRINYIFIISDEEYNFIKKTWPNLPKYIKLPHTYAFFKSNQKIKKNNLAKPQIVIGNSRGIYNNHIDVIDLIEKYSTKRNYIFTLLFNYGKLSIYTNHIVNKTKNKSYYNLIKNFLTKEEFLNFYENPSALVINSYRQLAWDNIRTAIKNGLKIYLNDKNVHKDFLVNNGFKIFSIDDFEIDLKENNLGFDGELAEHNLKTFETFSRSYTKDDFQKKLIEDIIKN